MTDNVVGRARLIVVPDLKEVGPALDKEGSGLVNRMKSIAAPIAGAFAGAFAIQKVGTFFKDAIGEATEAAAIGRQTAAVIKSTGGAAKVSADDIDRLTDSLSRKNAVDDEAIASNANLLLTFTNIRNEAGKGNDVFNQAQQTILDMSAALGQDGKSSAIQLGKALNDPIKGITALSRVGVSFTEQQKEQIKAMVASGDTLGAQKLILAELNREFAGSAEAAATPMDRLRIVIGNVKEEIGARLLPVVNHLAEWFAERLPKALDALGPIFSKVVNTVKTFYGVLFKRDFSGGSKGVFEEDSPVIAALFKFRDVVAGVMKVVVPLVTRAFDFMREHWDLFKGALLGAGVAAVFIGIKVALAAVVSLIVGLGASIAVALGPVTLIALAIGAVIGGLVIAYKRFEGFRELVQKVAGFITERIGQLADWWRSIWPQLAEAVGHVFNVIRAVIGGAVDFLRVLWRVFGDDLMRIAGAVFNQIRATIEYVMGLVSGYIRLILAVINGDWGKAWQAVKDIIGTTWEYIKATLGNLLRFLGGLGGAALSALGSAAKLLFNWGKDLVLGLVDGVRSMKDKLINAIVDLIPGPVKSVVKKALGIASPSKVFRGFGIETVRGYIGGVEHMRFQLEDAMRNVLPGGAPQFAMAGVPSGATAGQAAAATPGTGGPTYLVLPDGRVLAELALQEGRTLRRGYGL